MFWAFLKHLVVCLFVLQCRRQTHGYDQSNQIMVSRVKGGDLFTVLDLNCDNSKCCLGNVESNVDERRFVNVSGGVCRFQCNTNTPTYLPYERKCVDFSGVLTTTKDLPNCQRWVSINYNHTHTMYTRKMSNVVDLEKGGHIYLGYNGSALLGYDSCSINKSRSAYLNPEGQWKSVSVEQYKFAVAFDHKHGLSTLQWTGVSKKITGLISKIIRLKLLCEKSENKSEDEHFCITFKTKGTEVYERLYSKLQPTTSCYKRKKNTTKSYNFTSADAGGSKIASKENMVAIVIGIVASVLVLLFVAAGIFVGRRYSRKRTVEIGSVNTNPTYERSHDASCAVRKKDEEFKGDSNNYQPLVQNTILRDSSGGIPVYQRLIGTWSTDANPKINHNAYGIQDPCNPGCEEKANNGGPNTITSEVGSDYCNPYSFNIVSGKSKSPVDVPVHPSCRVLENSINANNNGRGNKQGVPDPYYHVLDNLGTTNGKKIEIKQEAPEQSAYYHVLEGSTSPKSDI